MLGYFLDEHVDLSLIFSFDYQNAVQSDGEREAILVTTALLEPSYHHPLTSSCWVFGGIGVGGGYDGAHGVALVQPRVGLAIVVGGAGVFKPAIDLPLLIGKGHGSEGDSVGVTPGMAVEMGIATEL